jgi:hypothetical protein
MSLYRIKAGILYLKNQDRQPVITKCNEILTFLKTDYSKDVKWDNCDMVLYGDQICLVNINYLVGLGSIEIINCYEI